ncbi:mercuric transporter MerT family protein [Teredinibacter haidensis]|uniref:mercuric transporter MerT family protein n=1 Tax=Teredinibacter haidensis TaxID=2731755 RepID=UPI000948A7FC|nr:mercuric transporter MerT family protein [Teredinibacter haidensis]
MLKNKSLWSILAGLGAAIGASLCCAGPLILLSLGVSGAWIANLASLEPYRPLFVAIVIVLFGWAGWRLFKTDSTGSGDCKPGEACAIPETQRNRKILFVVSLIAAIGFVASPYWIPLFV